MTEPTKLVGTGNQGDFVLETQGGSEGFKNVSQYWLPKTQTFDEMRERLQKHYDRRLDIKTPFKGFRPAVVHPGKLVFVAQGGPTDGAEYTMTEHALKQYLLRLDIPYHGIFDLLENKMNPSGKKVKIKRDSEDIGVVKTIIENGLRHYHSRGDNAKKVWRFRTYDDTKEIAAVLSEKYSCIDNRWYLEIINELIPGGRYSHFDRADDNTIYGNVLIPDSIRQESDSEYGGMLSLANSEIGDREISQYPSVFRAICMNGCIWDRTKGSILRHRHVGLVLDTLKRSIIDNVHKQIPLVNTGIDKLLATRAEDYKVPDVKMARIFVAVGERFNLDKKQTLQSLHQWAKYEKDNKNLFGVINGITRAGQTFGNKEWVKLDEAGGDMAKWNKDRWNSLIARAKSFTEDEVLAGISADEDYVAALA